MNRPIIGLGYAVKGFLLAVREERNLRIHLAAVSVVCAYGLIGGLTRLEWCAIVFCCSLVIGTELLNSAIERAGDRITAKRDTMIGKAKDMAAGSVLVSAVGAIISGVVIFTREGILERIFATPWSFVPVGLIPAFLLFIFGIKKKS